MAVKPQESRKSNSRKSQDRAKFVKIAITVFLSLVKSIVESLTSRIDEVGTFVWLAYSFLIYWNPVHCSKVCEGILIYLHNLEGQSYVAQQKYTAGSCKYSTCETIITAGTVVFFVACIRLGQCETLASVLRRSTCFRMQKLDSTWISTFLVSV